ncbi:MAG: GFA family protein [Comamonas sp.]|jgi:hypothetical protein|uniref:GFA family protein n=1 Tax=Comamonas sp. TaxID=34028 RepID=UPI0028309898|nr:GFA family protein [Comamonas sp.]MDR0216503.1 GFA family protein [Comamonas sp.]
MHIHQTSESSTAITTGSCLCGQVRFAIHGELAGIQVCHCSQCRKAQGGPLATNIPVNQEQIRWIAGRDQLRHFESSPGKLRAFCPQCGSPVYSQRSSLAGVLRIRAGLLDEQVRTSLDSHQYVASHASWWPVPDDGLPRHEEAIVPASAQAPH